jgi:hypothetical protein
MDKTEGKLIKAAREVLESRGYSKTTTAEIAKVAKVSEMTLFRKFRSKENLIRIATNYPDMPSSYDYFYYDFMIFKKALSLRKEILKSEDKVLASGYIYFVEFCIGKIISRIEQAPYNKQIFEIVNLGRFDISSREIQHYLKNNTNSFKRIYSLNDLRSQLSSLRHNLKTNKDEFDKDKLNNILEKLERLIVDINSEIVTLYEAKKRPEINDTIEKLMIFNRFMITYVYEPPHLFFSTMSDSTARSLLTEPKYLSGFKFCIEKIMNWFTNEKYKIQIKKGLEELDSFEYIHNFYSKMHGIVLKDTHLVRIFDIIECEWKNEDLFKGKEVTEEPQLNIIFRGRSIKVVNVEEINGIMGNREIVQKLLIDIILGELSLGGTVEVILFEEHVPDGKDWDNYFSYAVYLPLHGMVGDASGWLVFPRLDGESNWEPYNDVKKFIEKMRYDWENKITLRKYKITADLLKKYINNKDLAEMWKKSTESKFEKGKGLLAEFWAYFYVWHMQKAELVEFHKESNGTEIDVIAENETTRYILQIKNSLSTDKEQLLNEINGVIEHFDKISKQYFTGTKKIEKILFVMDWNSNGKGYMEEFSRFNTIEEYLLNRYNVAKLNLRKNDINLIIYSNIRMAINSVNEELLKRIDYVFDIEKQ